MQASEKAEISRKYRIKKRGMYGVWGKVFCVDEIVPRATAHKGYFVKPLKWFWTEQEASEYMNKLKERNE